MRQILYLYREIMPYNIPVLKEIVDQGFLITVLHETRKKLTPYVPPELENVTFLDNERFNRKQLAEMALSLRPCLVYVSDRTNSIYNYTAIALRKKLKIPVISGFDSQWIGGKQWFNVFTSCFRHKRFFSHVLIAGIRQFEYAKKLGFSNNKILWPLYSANNELFIHLPIEINKFKRPRNLLYVGRFASVKGLDVLLRAWSKVSNKNGATLTLVGNGPLKDKFKYPKDVILYDFINQEELSKLASQSSCFVLPSIFEPWALVIHEFAAAGLPLIVTDSCGGSPHFVINNYNGYIVRPSHDRALKEALERVLQMPEDELVLFGKRSRQLSYGITPQMVAYAITSVLDDSKE